MSIENRPLYVRLSPEERELFDSYCEKMNVNFSIVVRAMIKEGLDRIQRGEAINLIAGVTKIGRPAKDNVEQ